MTAAETHLQLGSSAFTAPDKILVATDLTDIHYLLPNAIAQCQAWGETHDFRVEPMRTKSPRKEVWP